MTRAACTIVSLNYLPYARTLCESFLSFHPDCKFYTLLVDRLPREFDASNERFELLLVEDLGIANFESVAFKYDILELNTNVKATFMKFLLARGVNQLIYFDPDICIYHDVRFIFELVKTHSIVLTPHCTSPTPEGDRHLEQAFLSLGVFNLGFVAVSSSAESLAFLDWWEQRCLAMGFAEARTGLFVDQKWINLVPCLFNEVYILKHIGCNVAYWNLFERQMSNPEQHFYLVNGETPLVFFHFSGLDSEQSESVSTKTRSPLTFSTRPDLKGLFERYKEQLHANRLPDSVSAKYAYASFSNGVPISTLARRVYASMPPENAAMHPFDCEASFYKFAKSYRLVGHADSSQRYDIRNYNRSDLRLRVLHMLFRSLLRLLGNDRYTGLLKYLSYISVLRNQIVLFQRHQRFANRPAKVRNAK